jgi:ParB-like chromosome segregation protein Spo0J
LKIADIKIGPRFRKDLGNIDTLARSIAEIGLLHPVVINQNNELIAGTRRLQACKSLGWNEIGVTIVNLDDIIKGEFAENTARKDFTYSEMIELKKVIEPQISKQAQEREKAGIPCEESAQGRTREKVAQFAGVSHDTLRKAEEVVQAAEQNPEKFEIILEQMDNDEISVNKAREIVRHQRRLEALQKITNPQTDLEILDKLGIKVRPYDIWNFPTLDLRFGKPYPGNIPADIVFNTLYFFTQQGDLVYDPMAGGGVVGDVCKHFRRKCLMYDIKSIRDDIKKYDILSGIPEEARGADLMFWDPPYYKKKEVEYGLNSISVLNKKNYLQCFEDVAKDAYNKGIKKIAFLMSDFDHSSDKQDGVKDRIYIWHYVERFERQSWKVIKHIFCPLSTEQIEPWTINKYKDQRWLARLTRSLVMFSRVDGEEEVAK